MIPRKKNTADPFVNQNAVYKELTGESIDIYIPVEYERSIDSENQIVYTLKIPDGKYTIYGNLPLKSRFTGTVSVNDSFEVGYAQWLAPSVFYIPCEEGAEQAVITVTSPNKVDLALGKEQFYALDLERFAEITKILQNREVKDAEIHNGHVRISVDSIGDERLFVSVSYDKGWSVMLNGKEIEPDLFADCLYSIKLEKGKNNVEMRYSVPFLEIGIAVSSLALTVLLIGIIRRRTAARSAKETTLDSPL